MPLTDRLSVLPDSLICHILSFLPTKLSVATSILSRRWRFLWTDVPNLHLSVLKFSDAICRIMSIYKVQSMNAFRLDYEPNCSDYQTETWITFAIARNVKIIDLYELVGVTLPRCLFTCKTLVELKLNNTGRITRTGAVCLPVLKKLQLEYVMFGSNESLPGLLSGCPLLEELIIEGILEDEGFELDCWYISSPTMKRLTLNFGDSYIDEFRLEINTPALRYLAIHGWEFVHISFGPLASLIEAYISIYIGNVMMEEHIRNCPAVSEIVGRLCHVKRLDFHCDAKIVDSTFSTWATRFTNLTKLWWDADWCLLSKILENADNLEVLDISQVCYCNKDIECVRRWMKPQQVPQCLLPRLRTISISQFKCTKHEFEVVSYLLMNAKALKMMKIYSRDWVIDSKAKFDALREYFTGSARIGGI